MRGKKNILVDRKDEEPLRQAMGMALDEEEFLRQARIFKEKGTKHFKDEKYEVASSWYQKVIDILENKISLKEDERKRLLQAGRLNTAMCHLKMSQWIEARGVCDKVKIDGSLVMFCLC